jgi:molybdopterin converting factor small subunit
MSLSPRLVTILDSIVLTHVLSSKLLAWYRSTISALNELLKGKDKEIASKEKEIVTLNSASTKLLEEKDERLKEKDELLKGQDREMTERLEEKDRLIAYFQNEASDVLTSLKVNARKDDGHLHNWSEYCSPSVRSFPPNIFCSYRHSIQRMALTQ